MHFVTDKLTLTHDHVKLLRRLHCGMNNYCRGRDEFRGAPGAGERRPFGNSDVVGDVCEALGWRRPSEDDDDWSPELEAETRARCASVYNELGKALDCVLNRGSFETGIYLEMSYGHRWLSMSEFEAACAAGLATDKRMGAMRDDTTDLAVDRDASGGPAPSWMCGLRQRRP